MIAPTVFRSPLVLSTTLILLATAAIVQFTQTQAPTKVLPDNDLSTDRLFQPPADAVTNSKAIEVAGGVWCGKNLQSCPN